MGRAYEVRKASIQKTGAIKAKLYSMYAKEIYQTAKNGGVNVDANHALKRLIEKAKKDQVPSDIIKRAIDKVNSGASENYDDVRYELFGPGGSTLIVDCLTDNVNRTLSYIRAVLNKTNGKMGVSGSTSYMYDNLSIIGFKGIGEEAVLDLMIENDVEIDDVQSTDDNLIIYAKPSDLFKIKETISSYKGDIEFDIDEIVMIPKDKVTLSGDDLEDFNKMLNMLEEIEDIQNIYHNVSL
ncbi:MAG: YebC/PmpR family DNA-binding transcriptional regulator [Bacilli bacterium]|nr:YebC/PmpR family DNA-binding transcriptional regulator [Bacilli bacterium]